MFEMIEMIGMILGFPGTRTLVKYLLSFSLTSLHAVHAAQFLVV